MATPCPDLDNMKLISLVSSVHDTRDEDHEEELGDPAAEAALVALLVAIRRRDTNTTPSSSAPDLTSREPLTLESHAPVVLTPTFPSAAPQSVSVASDILVSCNLFACLVLRYT